MKPKGNYAQVIRKNIETILGAIWPSALQSW